MTFTKRKKRLFLAAVLVGFGLWLAVRKDLDRFLAGQDLPSVQNQIYAEAENRIGDHVLGELSAPLKIYIYSDYSCAACAALNAQLANLLAEFGGQIAIVPRSYAAPAHKNSAAAARAAEAAGLQGFWQPYNDLLFNRQPDWANLDAGARQAWFEQAFAQIAGEKGDLDQFRTDMNSDLTAEKLEFDQNLAEKAKISFTPWIFVENTHLSAENLTKNGAIEAIRQKTIDFLNNL